MNYDQATRFGRSKLPVMNGSRAVFSEPRKPMTPEQKHRARFLNECRMRELQDFIDQCAGKKEYFAVYQRWREELIQLHEQF
jgi:hypothetical protein